MWVGTQSSSTIPVSYIQLTHTSATASTHLSRIVLLNRVHVSPALPTKASEDVKGISTAVRCHTMIVPSAYKVNQRHSICPSLPEICRRSEFLPRISLGVIDLGRGIGSMHLSNHIELSVETCSWNACSTTRHRRQTLPSLWKHRSFDVQEWQMVTYSSGNCSIGRYRSPLSVPCLQTSRVSDRTMPRRPTQMAPLKQQQRCDGVTGFMKVTNHFESRRSSATSFSQHRRHLPGIEAKPVHTRAL